MSDCALLLETEIETNCFRCDGYRNPSKRRRLTETSKMIY